MKPSDKIFAAVIMSLMVLNSSLNAAPVPALANPAGTAASASATEADSGRLRRDSPAPFALAPSGSATVQLSADAQAVIQNLQARDGHVRQHEQAHLAAAGGLATSGPIYEYQRGPDGKSYAIGGEVNIDVSPGRTPQETVVRARIIQAAALAPADPSGADRSVALRAQQMEQQAEAQLAMERIQGQNDVPPAHADSQGNPAASRQAADLERAYGAEAVASPDQTRLDVYG